MKFKRVLLALPALSFLLLLFSAHAQQPGFRFRQKNDVKVIIGTDTLKHPWAGGLNAPVFSKIDLNRDGTSDLYVFDRMNNKAFTFLAENAGGTWQWKYAPEYEAFFPSGLSGWVLLRDYNNDGQPDLFTTVDDDGAIRVRVFKNISAQNSRLMFAASAVNLGHNVPDGMAVGDHNLPAFEDIDNDGDLDMLCFDPNAAREVQYFRNRRVEDALPMDSLRFAVGSLSWGQFERCMPCNEISAPFNNYNCTAYKPMHGGSGTILALDLDSDGDKDILTGAEDCTNLLQLTNTGTAAAAQIGSANSQYPSAANAVNMVHLPAAYYEDVNFDGNKDLLVAPFLPRITGTVPPNLNHSSWLYQNMAGNAAAAPVFGFVQDNFLQSKMLDLGEGAAPAFADVDADGDLDMLVGNYADYRTGGNVYRSAVSLYTNIGTVSRPEFKLTNSDYLQFSQADYRGIRLQFADMNGDGSQDLIIKYLDFSGFAAYLDYIPNTAAAGQPYSFSRNDQAQVAINTINETDAPFFYDLDGDGDLDLLLGTSTQNPNNPNSGAIYYYKRVGANVSSYTSWQLFDDKFGKIPRNVNNRSAQPFIADINQDNNPDLLLSGELGDIRFYPNIMTNLNGTFQEEKSVFYNALNNNYVSMALGKDLHAAVADLDADQKPELIIGTNGGGLVYFKNEAALLGIGPEKEELLFAMYPNPATDLLTFTTEALKAEFTVFDLAGRPVLNGVGGKQQQIQVSGLKPGVYFLQVAAAGKRAAGKTFIVQR